MKRLSLTVFVLLLLTAVEADNAEVQIWSCVNRGLCRRFCSVQEYVVGYDGCPRRYRWTACVLAFRALDAGPGSCGFYSLRGESYGAVFYGLNKNEENQLCLQNTTT